MIRRGRLKFVHSPADPDLLFDLEHDPDELHNLAAEPAHATDVKSFREETARRWDLPRLHEEILRNQRRRHLIASALKVGAAPHWDYEQEGTKDGPYVRGADFWAPFKRARVRR